MKLSRKEELFLIHWMIDEANFEHGRGPAKSLQIEHGVSPARLAEIIAAWEPNPAKQAELSHGPRPSEPPEWPWQTPADFKQRHEIAMQHRELV